MRTEWKKTSGTRTSNTKIRGGAGGKGKKLLKKREKGGSSTSRGNPRKEKKKVSKNKYNSKRRGKQRVVKGDVK